ncbi:hypothetical protein F441_02564 [Phytophthora nicotianae CJ01A1]|uniref:Uncharacterized protein n=1 Tax=Phytophthora nicotianae CJ01A1 TaxID=1317063 RepID=W2XR85_PHYNI|nr:hypothetical protein F441_02564 [Phytophthora nicotianae CJ01A1]
MLLSDAGHGRELSFQPLDGHSLIRQQRAGNPEFPDDCVITFLTKLNKRLSGRPSLRETRVKIARVANCSCMNAL